MQSHNYQIIKSDRKSFAINVKQDTTVIIRVPLQAQKEAINQFIYDHQGWIDKKVDKFKTLAETTPQADNMFYFMGKQYSSIVSDSRIEPIYFNGTSFLVRTEFMGSIAALMPHWYIQQAYKLIEPILQSYAHKFNLRYTSFKITQAQTRLGSCNSKGGICFSYHLMKAPPDVITYVVVHELSHLVPLNHSPKFWQQVSLMCPNYKTHVLWLRNNNRVIS